MTLLSRATSPNAAPSPKRPRRAWLAMIEGRSGRAMLDRIVRDLTLVPAFLRSFLARRDRRSWIFGNRHGFRDSPRYLAEYIQHSRPDLKASWIARNEAEAEAARAAGIDAVVRGRSDARRLQRHAGLAVFTHGYGDLNLEHLGGADLVFVWHGTPLKRVGLDVRVSSRRRSFARLAGHIVRWESRRLFSLVNVFIAAGQLEHRRFRTAFAVSAERVPILGSPRFDVIRGGTAYDRIVQGDLRSQLGYAKDDFIILWLPTHRSEYGDARWLPSLTAEQLEQALQGTNVKLLVKPHPLAEWDVFRDRLPTTSERMRLMPAADLDVNCLLHIADALISDYSSVVCDYAILNRPIYFLAPDVDIYSDKRGLYDPYEVLTGGNHHADWPSLLAAIRSDIDSPQGGEGTLLVRRLNDYLGLNLEPDVCARIVAQLDRSPRDADQTTVG